MYIEIDRKDLNRLLEALEYAIVKTEDKVIGEYLKQEYDGVKGHLDNERTGKGDETIMEIDSVLNFIGRK